MMRLVVLSVVIIGSLGSPAFQTLTVNEDGTYQFAYETGSTGGSHSRTESKGPDGAVIGKYSYKDPTGGLRVVNYRAADDTGFLSSEDGELPKPSASELSVVPGLAEGSEKDKAEQKEENKTPAEQQEETKTSAEQKEEAKTPSTTEATDEEEDEKLLKLEEPIDEGPPEGFPPGFFSEQFSALRRLPEPKKEEEKPVKTKDDDKTHESSTDGAKNTALDLQGHINAILQQPEGFPPGFFLHHFTGLRRLPEPVKLEESSQTIDNTNPDDMDSGATTEENKNPGQGFYSSYVLPFPSLLPQPLPLVPQVLPASSHHHPVHVYSYQQQPGAYSYGYHY